MLLTKDAVTIIKAMAVVIIVIGTLAAFFMGITTLQGERYVHVD